MLPPAPLHRLLRFIFVALAAGSSALLAQTQPASAAGQIAGQVSNGATRALLEGAAIEIPALGVRTLTDSQGRFRIEQLPAGNHAVVVSYTGLNREERRIAVAAGQQVSALFDLGSEVYRLEKFSVVGEREGNAAALTAQRNADSVKSVVALDAYGNLSNSEAGELLIRLPGIAGSLNGEGVVSEVMVRGTNHTLNSVTVDGNKMASSGGMNRNFRTNSIPGAFFDTIEVTKAATPDMDADSLGGNINMKTRSPLSMKEKRRMIYRLGGKWAPPFYDHNPATRNHSLHPMTSFSYQEAFDAFGGDRNLGVTFSMFYSENAVSAIQMTQDYAFVTTSPAYVWDYRSADIYNNRLNRSATLKLDYRFSPTLRVFLNGIYNDAHERSFEYLRTRAFTSRTLAALNAAGQPTGNNAILPDFTDKITRVRAVPASTFELQTDGNRFEDSQRQLHAGAEHTYARFTLDYDGAYSESIVRQNDGHNSPKVGSGGFFRTWLTGVGWTLDKTGNEMRPKFTQTDGPSIFDLKNYTNSELNKRDNERNGTLESVSANAKYFLDARRMNYLKAGGRFRRQAAEEVGGDRRWQYAGPDGIVGVNPATGRRDDDLSLFQFNGVQTTENLRNGPIPYTHVGYVAEHVKKTRRTGSRIVTTTNRENISARVGSSRMSPPPTSWLAHVGSNCGRSAGCVSRRRRWRAAGLCGRGLWRRPRRFPIRWRGRASTTTIRGASRDATAILSPGRISRITSRGRFSPAPIGPTASAARPSPIWCRVRTSTTRRRP